MEKNVEYFSFYVKHDWVERVYFIESKDKKIIKSELLDDRFKRIFNFVLGDHSYEDIVFFLKSRTLRDAKKGNLKEIYESILATGGTNYNDTLSIEFIEFNIPENGDD